MKQKTAIIHIITKLELGGAQKIALALLDGCNESHTDTFLISGAKGTLVDQVKDNPNIILLDTLVRDVSIKNFLWLEIKNFFKLIFTLRKFKKRYSHIIVHTHSTKAGIVGRWAAFFAGIKRRVHTIHGFGFNDHQRWIVRWSIISLEWFTSLITTKFICVSSKDAQTGVCLFPRFSKKHEIIRAAIDTEKFYIPAKKISSSIQPALETSWPSESNKPFIFGTVSAFTQPGKNIPEMIRAFKYVHNHNPNTGLEIIGDGILRPVIEQAIEFHKLQSQITLHGWQDSPAPFMINWDVFVMSSLWEGLPCAVVEARLLKLPVIAYNTGGISDVIEHGKNGLLYDQKYWLNIARGMLELSEKPELVTKFSSHTDDLSSFTYPAMVEQHVKLYESL